MDAATYRRRVRRFPIKLEPNSLSFLRVHALFREDRYGLPDSTAKKTHQRPSLWEKDLSSSPSLYENSFRGDVRGFIAGFGSHQLLETGLKLENVWGVGGGVTFDHCQKFTLADSVDDGVYTVAM